MANYFLHEQIYRDLGERADALVTIAGAGALGANLTEHLARMGLRNLRVLDHDLIEARNLSTQPWQTQDIGASKARTLTYMLYRAVGARVDGRHVFVTQANAGELVRGSTLVVDAFDNIASRRIISRAAHARSIPCCHIALGGEGDYGCALWDDAYVLPATTEAPDLCDYPLARPVAHLVAAAAAEAIFTFLMDGTRRGFEVTLRDLRLTPA